MSIVKDIFIEEYERLCSEAEEAGWPVDESKIAVMANEAMKDRFAAMCDEAKDRAKYGQ